MPKIIRLLSNARHFMNMFTGYCYGISHGFCTVIYLCGNLPTNVLQGQSYSKIRDIVLISLWFYASKNSLECSRFILVSLLIPIGITDIRLELLTQYRKYNSANNH